jgi:glycosyltransferase involved in cell wall biosynthesis
MRFLMLNWRDPHNPLSGGAERVTLGYLSALARRGHQVFWFAHSFEGAPPEDTLEGVRIIRAGDKKSAAYLAFRWHRRQPSFDLVIDQHHGIPWYAPWWCRTNCVAYIHEVLGPIWDAFYQWPYNVIGRHQERWTHWLYRKVPFWTACPSTKIALEEMGVRDITIVPYGVHTRALPMLEEKGLDLPLRLAVVSRLAPNKRVDHAMRAFRILCAEGIEARLTVVGSGVVENQLRALAGELGIGDRALFTGGLPEKQKDEILRRSHILLHASMREGWGLNVIEANAMGTPAVVYPVPGLVESTLHGQTGFVAENESPEAMAAAIKQMISHPARYQELRHRAWERAKEYHWDQVLPQACAWLEQKAGGCCAGTPVTR